MNMLNKQDVVNIIGAARLANSFDEDNACESRIDAELYDVLVKIEELPSIPSDSNRLREALEKIVDILCDDTSLTAQRINNVIIHALSTTAEPKEINLTDTDVKGSVEFKRRSWEQSEPTGAERVWKCPHCSGTGVEPIHFHECRPCDGTGIYKEDTNE